MTIYTIGHSTRPIEEFIELLETYGIKQLADVRTIPKSRHNPQYNSETLAASLDEAGIGYLHLTGLGGLRHAQADSVNTGWRNASFRGYADYMQTTEFDATLTELTELASGQPSAIMCAEAVPWRCHRSMIADALIARGQTVYNIMTITSAPLAQLTSFAVVENQCVTYPSESS